jgi:hypothetical protein
MASARRELVTSGFAAHMIGMWDVNTQGFSIGSSRRISSSNSPSRSA